MTLQNASVSSWEGPGRVETLNLDAWVSSSGLVRTGASVEDNARAAIEDIMGYQSPKAQPGSPGYKPPRADIAKMKEASENWFEYQKALKEYAEDKTNLRARQVIEWWLNNMELTQQERALVGIYNLMFLQGTTKGDTNGTFEYVAQLASAMLNPDPAENQQIDSTHPVPPNQASLPPATEEGKKWAGQVLKKYEQSNWPTLYRSIADGLADAYRTGVDSYKLWPWMVKTIKTEFQRDLITSNGIQTADKSQYGQGQGPRRLPNLGHIVDITTDGGRVLQKLREDNKIPNNFDVNKMDFKEFEEWLMDWKRENNMAESQGHVVYTFHDDWTIQKLTTPEQLQFEGDEMGHCVGGQNYANRVERGTDIIYSLRDPKGNPHVTMEVEALEGPPNLEGEPDEGELAANEEPIHPDAHMPGEHLEHHYTDSYEGAYRPTGETPFEIVQIQGNGNLTPKPEYQRKIKEFLDSLRAKGWKFVRSENWYGNYDGEDAEDNDDDLDSNADARDLIDWWNNKYKTNPKPYQTGGEDAYGMNRERKNLAVSFDKIFESSVQALTNTSDRGSYQTGQWESLAQATYHAYMVDIYKDRLNPEALEQHKQNFEKERQYAEEQLQDRISEYINDYTPPDEIHDKAMELAKKQGVELSEEAQEYAESFEDEHEDLWMEARDEIQSEYEDAIAGNAYKYLGYLYMLIEHHGAVNPADLPDPNDRNGGLHGYDDLIAANTPNGDISQTAFDAQPQVLKMPGTFSNAWKPGAVSTWNPGVPEISIVPIDETNNQWFDEEGGPHDRWRPGWAKDPTTGRMVQTGQLEDTFLDKKGRQAEGFVAYHGSQPVGSLTYVDEGHRHMLGTAYVHPNYREQGLFNRLVEPLRASGKPVDAYVWNNPWLQQKVRSWRS